MFKVGDKIYIDLNGLSHIETWPKVGIITEIEDGRFIWYKPMDINYNGVGFVMYKNRVFIKNQQLLFPFMYEQNNEE